MAIGSIGSNSSWYPSNNSWYSDNTSKYGPTTDQQNSSSSFFGNVSADGLFSATFEASSAATGSISVGANDAIIKGMQDEISRIQGFRTDLTVAQKQQLADYQSKISDIEKLASTRALTDEEVKQRADLYTRSYKLLGKDYLDVSNDSFVKKKLAAIDDLLATKPKGADVQRLAHLKDVETNLTNQINSAGENGATITLSKQLLSVKSQIYSLTQPRKFLTLSQSELKQYDELANAINDHLGQEYQLPSAKRLKIERIQKTIDTMQSSGGGSTNILV